MIFSISIFAVPTPTPVACASHSITNPTDFPCTGTCKKEGGVCYYDCSARKWKCATIAQVETFCDPTNISLPSPCLDDCECQAFEGANEDDVAACIEVVNCGVIDDPTCSDCGPWSGAECGSTGGCPSSGLPWTGCRRSRRLRGSSWR